MPNSTGTRSSAGYCQAALIDVNLRWLRQALVLLAKTDDNAYSTTPPGFAPHCVGAHVRHILDFYQCFLNGLEAGRIDYDARSRDRDIETSRSSACIAIRSVIGWLKGCPTLQWDTSVLVRPEDADSCAAENSFICSSISRELQALSSHTVHHFALIGMTLRAHGIGVNPEFGMAPSTLRFLASKSQQSEEAA